MLQMVRALDPKVNNSRSFRWVVVAPDTIFRIFQILLQILTNNIKAMASTNQMELLLLATHTVRHRRPKCTDPHPTNSQARAWATSCMSSPELTTAPPRCPTG